MKYVTLNRINRPCRPLYTKCTGPTGHRSFLGIHVSFTWVLAGTYFLPTTSCSVLKPLILESFSNDSLWSHSICKLIYMPYVCGKCHDIFNQFHLTNLLHSRKAIPISLSWYKFALKDVPMSVFWRLRASPCLLIEQCQEANSKAISSLSFYLFLLFVEF